MNRKTYILSILFVLLGLNSQAVHLVPMGGDISYRYVSGDNYEVTVRFYRDCQSLAGSGISDLLVQSTSCGISGSVYSLNLISSGEVTPLCPANQNLSDCQGGSTFTGIYEEVYQGTISLPQHCTDYVFSVSECCRNSAISNLLVPSASFALLGQLNNGTVNFNNSATFNAPPSFYLTAGQTYYVDFSATDIDGDSLVYEVVEPFRTSSTSIPYNAPYSPANPINSLPPASIDAVTGILSLTPTIPQDAVIAVRVREYRGGVLVGTVYRDVNLFVRNLVPYNTPPALSGFDSTTVITTYACVGDTISFRIYTADPDQTQTLVLDTLQTVPGATITINSGVHPSLDFFWVVGASDVSAVPYLLRLKVTDDGCPVYFSQTRVLKLYVTNCGAPVWPGDANSDFTANIYDLLPIGLAYGYTGPSRPFATNNWTGQAGNDWAWDFVSGVNFKHADCDGNGVIDINDTTAIVQNYGQLHAKQQEELRGSVMDPVLQFISFDDTVTAGSTITIPIHLGTTQQPADDVYGIAFSVFYDPTLVVADSITITYPNSWLGTLGNEMISLEYNIPTAGQIDIGISRTTQLAINGSGEICQVNIVMQDDITGKDLFTAPLTFGFGGALMINASGLPLPLNTEDLTIVAKQATAINELDNTLQASVYPNPATDVVSISSPGNQLEGITLYNVLGAKVMEQSISGLSQAQINISTLAPGVYTAEIKDLSGKTKLCRIVRNISH